MKKLNNQEVFDKVVTALRAQGCQSLDANGNRMYRGLNNAKCAAGHILPDHLYIKGMEQYIVYDSPVFDSIVEKVSFLRSLQRIHDVEEVSAWEDSWEELALDNGLIYTPKS